MADLAQRLGIVVYVEDQATGKLQRVKAEVQGLGPAAGRAGSGVASGMGRISAATRQVSKGVHEVASGLAKGVVNLAKFGVAAAGAAVGGVVALAKAAGDFQAQLNTINTIAQVSQGRLGQIGQGIRDLAVRGGADLGDLTGAYYDLLSAGVQVADAQRYLDLSFRLSRGALSTTGEAVDFLTTAVNAYSLKGSQASVVADQFAQAVADGKVKLSEISATFADVAKVAQGAGIGIDEIAASYGYLTAQGVPAAEVTTQMNRAIIELLKPNADLLKLQKKTKENYADLAREKGLVAALQQMRTDAEKAGIPFQDLFGRLEGYKYALATTGPANAAFNAELEKIHKSTGALDRQFAERAQGFQFQVGRLRAALLSLAITAGNELLPRLTPVVQTITDKLASPEVVGRVQRAASELGRILGEVFSEDNIANAEKFANDVLPSIVDGMRLTASIAKDAVSAFNSLPNDLKAAAIALVAGNKLTGGLVAKGVGDIVGGLAKGGIASLGGLVPGKAGKVLGALGARGTPVYVTNWPAGGFGGGGPSIPAGAGGAGAAAGGIGLGTLAGLAGIAAIPLAYNLIYAFRDQSAPGEGRFANANGQVVSTQQTLGATGVSDAQFRQLYAYGPLGRMLDQAAADKAPTRDRGFEVDNNPATYGPGGRDMDKALQPAEKVLEHLAAIGIDIKANTARTAAESPLARASKEIAAAVERVREREKGRTGSLLENSRYVERQLAAAQRAANGTDSLARKQDALARIQRDLLAHGDRWGASQVAKLSGILAKRTSVSVTTTASAVTYIRSGGSAASTNKAITNSYISKMTKAGAFAAGGDYPAGRPRLVGEEGPELDVPAGTGRVFTAEHTRRLLALAGGPGSVTAAGNGLDGLVAELRAIRDAVTGSVPRIALTPAAAERSATTLRRRAAVTGSAGGPGWSAG